VFDLVMVVTAQRYVLIKFRPVIDLNATLKFCHAMKIHWGPHLSDIYVPNCWVDLSFKSRIIISLKLKSSEPSKQFRVILSSIYLSVLKRLLQSYALEIVLDFDLKILNFKTRKRQRLLLKESSINLVLGHRNATIFICKETTTKTSF
jgi:hypothetical protein